MSDSAPLVVISCGSQKKPGGPHPAGALYTGQYFQMLLKTALLLTPRESVRILSGKYGLVPLDAPLHSYNQRIDRPGAVSWDAVLEQASTQGLLGREVVLVLAGEKYASVCSSVWVHARVPLLSDPPARMAFQLAWLSQAITLPDPLSFFLNPETSVWTPVPTATRKWHL